jgi:hypothetical protein
MAIVDLRFRSSPLPNPPIIYDPQYVRQLIRVIELYFSQLDAWNLQVYNALTTTGGGASLKFPYFSAYQDGNTALTGNITNVSTTPIPVTSTTGFESSGFIIIGNEIIQHTGKTATTFTGITRGVKSTTNVAHNSGDAVTEAAGVTVGTAEAINLDAVDYESGIYLGGASSSTPPDSKIYAQYDGLYNLQFSLQLLNYSNAEDNVTVWLRKNGTDVPLTASVEQVNSKHGSNPGATIMALNLYVELLAGQYVQLYWHSLTGNTVLATAPPGTSPVHPASPAAIVTVSFVSALP